MTLQKRFSIILTLLVVLILAGIIIPSYLKIRDLELKEAKTYLAEQSLRMKEAIDQKITILGKAGVANIDSYMKTSQLDLIEQYSKEAVNSKIGFLIFDEQGKPLLSGSPQFSTPISENVFRQLRQPMDNIFSYQDTDQTWQIGHTKHEQWNWHLLTSMPEVVVYKNSREYLRYVLAISLLVFFAAISLFVLLTRELRNKLKTMLAQISLYRDYEFDERLEVTKPKELGELQQGINTLADSFELKIQWHERNEEKLKSAKFHQPLNQKKINYFADLDKASHHIINATHNITGFSELLGQAHLEGSQKNYAKHISHAGQLLIESINNFLNPNLSSHRSTENSFSDDEKTINHALSKKLEDLQILCIDSDALSQSLLTELMRKHGLNHTTRNSINEAAEIIKSENIDLILLDMGVSDLRNDDFITQLRENPDSKIADLPIALITNNASEKELAHYIQLGASAYLKKPFSEKMLLSCIESFIKKAT